MVKRSSMGCARRVSVVFASCRPRSGGLFFACTGPWGALWPTLHRCRDLRTLSVSWFCVCLLSRLGVRGCFSFSVGVSLPPCGWVRAPHLLLGWVRAPSTFDWSTCVYAWALLPLGGCVPPPPFWVGAYLHLCACASLLFLRCSSRHPALQIVLYFPEYVNFLPAWFVVG